MSLVYVILLTIGTIQVSHGEDKEVTKTEDLNDRQDDPDQIALESVDQKGASSAHHVYVPASVGINRANNVHGQHFGQNLPAQMAYHGPPPPLPNHHNNKRYENEILNAAVSSNNELWAAPVIDTPKIVSLDVKCERSGMKVFLQFDKPFFGIVFSKGHYSNINCVHLAAGSGRTSTTFEIGIRACGTAGNTDNSVYAFATDTIGSGLYFENIIVIQYDPQVQEVWDVARKLRCTWHDQYEKSVTFRPFPVDMLDVIRADFAGDNVGCWMQIQVGKGPWASEVSGLVKIGQTMTMVLAIKDDDSKFDMLVRNCQAHDGKRTPIQLVDQRGCVMRPKLMSRFTKIKNFGASASVLSYAHFQAFKFPDSMEVHFQCTIQICRYECPDQCTDPGLLDVQHLTAGPESQYGPLPPPPPPLPLQAYLHSGIGERRRDEKQRIGRRSRSVNPEKEIGLNRIIKVVSSGDLTFSIDEKNNSTQTTMVFPAKDDGLICMTAPGLAVILIILLGILIVSCLVSAFLCIRLKPFSLSEKERNLNDSTSSNLTATSATHLSSTLKKSKQSQTSTLTTSQKRKFSFYS